MGTRGEGAPSPSRVGGSAETGHQQRKPGSGTRAEGCASTLKLGTNALRSSCGGHSDVLTRHPRVWERGWRWSPGLAALGGWFPLAVSLELHRASHPQGWIAEGLSTPRVS